MTKISPAELGRIASAQRQIELARAEANVAATQFQAAIVRALVSVGASAESHAVCLTCGTVVAKTGPDAPRCTSCFPPQEGTA
jgi:hypothetical protein